VRFEKPYVGQKQFPTASTGMWIIEKKSFRQGLTYFHLLVRLQMVRHSLGVLGHAGDSQSGLNYLPGEDPIVRSLISTG
jgi:hypothetical protein